MNNCPKRQTPVKRRELLNALFEHNPKAAAKHRVEVCYHASECGRLCRWLVKGPGIELVRCQHPSLPVAPNLYESTGRVESQCPEGFW